MHQSLSGEPPLVHSASQPAIIADFEIRLEVEHVLEGQGIPPARASAPVVAVARAVLDEAQTLLAPAAMYTILPVHGFEHQQVTLANGAAFSGSLAARAFAGATELAIAVCTIGPALEERVSALFAEGDSLRAVAMEGAGIAAIRQVSTQVGIRVCDVATARGLRVGMRANPGQEGWSILQQRVVFGLMPAEKIGVRLTSSCLMLPAKSVSFVVGLGPEMRADAVPCDFCSKRERCQWRREKA
jgi:hypothetical protein